MAEIKFEQTVTDIVAADGTIHSIDVDKLITVMKNNIENAETEIKKRVENINICHPYNTFEVDTNKLLKYDEKNTDTYPHFVYHFLRNFYGTCEFSNPMMNGGRVECCKYNHSTGYHIRLIEDTIKGDFEPHIRDRIIMHLNAGIYCNFHSKYKMMHNDIDPKALIDFICKSDMFDLYEKPKLSEREYNNYVMYYRNKTHDDNMQIKHFGVSLIDFCLCYDISVLKHLLTNYLDIYKLESILYRDKDSGVFHYVLKRLWISQGVYKCDSNDISDYHKLYKHDAFDPILYMLGKNHMYYNNINEITSISDNIDKFCCNPWNNHFNVSIRKYLNLPIDLEQEHLVWLIIVKQKYRKIL